MKNFLERLSNPHEPIPGGGAAAAYAASTGLALLKKIVRIELARPGVSANGKSLLEDTVKKIEELSKSLIELRERDGESYLELSAARSAHGRGSEEYAAALETATKCPMSTIEAIKEALACVSVVLPMCKRHLRSDVLVAAELLGASARSASHIARANIGLFTDRSHGALFSMQLDILTREVEKLVSETVERVLPEHIA
jgi:formiminotetrahydrofolate cyclodeaminase